jgi:DNA primase small subunit
MLQEASIAFVKSKFREFYFKNSDLITGPPEPERREIGYETFENTMIRHLRVNDVGELRALVLQHSPRSLYYSAAYYQEPNLPMEEKGWLGADLFLDIDADMVPTECAPRHNFKICTKCRTPYANLSERQCYNCGNVEFEEQKWVCKLCIGKTKDEVEKVLDFFTQDFGIDADDIEIYFSGNRGYHILVRTQDVKGLGQRERLEIIDYLMGRGISPEFLGLIKGARPENLYHLLPSPEEPGWRGRVGRQTNKKEVMDVYRTEGFERAWSIIQAKVDAAAAHIDPVVTSDLHRLIRMENTLHGETGLIKKRCYDLNSFQPTVDAVAFGREPVKITVSYSPEIWFDEQNYGPYRDEVVEVPESLAIYLILKGTARLARP